MPSRRTTKRLDDNWVSIVLTVLSIIQGSAFVYLAKEFPKIYDSRNFLLIVHFILGIVIVLRAFQTFMTAVLDYNVLPKFFEISLVSIVGILEYFLLSTLKNENSFDPFSFHKRGLILSTLGVIAYFIILLRFLRSKRRNKRGKRSLTVNTITLLRLIQKPPKTYSKEVRLQKTNIIGLIVIIGIESLIVFFRPVNAKISVLACPIILIVCFNIYYSVRTTF